LTHPPTSPTGACSPARPAPPIRAGTAGAGKKRAPPVDGGVQFSTGHQGGKCQAEECAAYHARRLCLRLLVVGATKYAPTQPAQSVRTFHYSTPRSLDLPDDPIIRAAPADAPPHRLASELNAVAKIHVPDGSGNRRAVERNPANRALTAYCKPFILPAFPPRCVRSWRLLGG